MSKVHVVQNNNDILMGVFKTRAKAKRFANRIGKKRWNESWIVTTVKLDDVELWILVGGDDYKARKRRRMR